MLAGETRIDPNDWIAHIKIVWNTNENQPDEWKNGKEAFVPVFLESLKKKLEENSEFATELLFFATGR